ncbi:MAG: LON peptidase substrate-binding domain-containing protein [Actinomycetota bacterium]
MSAGQLLPLFPLATVLVPGLVLPLHIFEPRYRQLVSDLQALPEDDREFVVVAIRDGREVGTDGARALFDVGTVTSVREVSPLDDGRFDIVTVGTRRVRIGELDTSLPYLRATVTDLPEESGGDTEPLAAAVAEQFVEYRSMFTDDDGSSLPDDPRVLSYLVAAAVVIDLPQRQDLLAAFTDADRLRAELAFLRRETSLIAALPSLPAVDLIRDEPSPN